VPDRGITRALRILLSDDIVLKWAAAKQSKKLIVAQSNLRNQ